MAQGPVLSVVDYAAWEKGYMPPAEHILIDKLAYRGARVISSNWLGGDNQMWIVLEGKPLTNTQRKFMRDLVTLMYADEEEPAPAPSTKPVSETTKE